MSLPISIPNNESDSTTNQSSPLQTSNNTTNGTSTSTQQVPLNTNQITDGAPPIPSRPILHRSPNNNPNAAANSNSNFSTDIYPALRRSEYSRTGRPRSRRRVSSQAPVAFFIPESSNPSSIPSPSPRQNDRSNADDETAEALFQPGSPLELPFPGFRRAGDAIEEAYSSFSTATDAMEAVLLSRDELSVQERRDRLDEADRRSAQLRESFEHALRILRRELESAEDAASDMLDRITEPNQERGSGDPSNLVPDNSVFNPSLIPSGTDDDVDIPSERRTQTAVEILAPRPRSPIAEQLRQLPGYQHTSEVESTSHPEDDDDEAARATREGAPSPEDLMPQNPTLNRATGDNTVNLDERMELLVRGPPRRDNTGRGSSIIANGETGDRPNDLRERPERDLTGEEIEGWVRHEPEQLRERTVEAAVRNADERPDVVEEGEVNTETALEETEDEPDQVASSNNSSRANTSPSSTGATAGSAGESSLTSSITQAVEEPRPTRQQIMRQMVEDMERYSRQREREFEREHRYCKWSPESLLERKATRNPSPIQSNSPISPLVYFGPPQSSSGSLVMRTLIPTSGLVSPPREGTPGVNEGRRGHQTRRNDRQNTAQTAERRLQRPASDQPDPSEDFLRFVLASNPPHREERDTTYRYFEETSTSPEQQRFIYSFIGRQMPSWEAEEQFYHERAALRVRESAIQSGVTIVVQLLLIAMRDCLDVRDARALLNQWASYQEDSVQRSLGFPNMVPPAALAFWVALRRGWGEWTPIDRDHHELREVRNLLQDYTEFDHTIDREANRITEDEILSGVRLIALSPEEQAVFEIMIEERQVPLNRIAQLYRNWAMYAPLIDDNSRQASEQHLSRNQLRMDRLSRLIREERVINSDPIEVEPSGRRSMGRDNATVEDNDDDDERH